MSTLVEKHNKVTLITVNNPFNYKDHENESIVIKDSTTLKNILPLKEYERVVSVNGEIVEDTDLDSRLCVDGDYIVIVPVPMGSGGSKSVLRIVAVLAVSYFTFGAGTGTLSSLLSGTMFGSGAGLFAAQTLTFAAGSALINKAMPIEPNVPKLESTLETSNSYALNGPKNSHEEGGVVPVVYGKYRVANNFVNLYIDNTDEQAQILYARMILSEGRIGHVARASVLINDQSIDDFDNIETQFRDGSDNQSGSSWFETTKTSISVGATLTTTSVTRTTTIPVDKFRVDLVAPAGLRRIDGTNSEPIVEPITIEYRKQGDVTWQTLNSTSTVSGYTSLYAFHHDFAFTPRARSWALNDVVYDDEFFWDTSYKTDALSIDSNGNILADLNYYKYFSNAQRYGGVQYSAGDKMPPNNVIVGYLDETPRYDDPPQMRGLYRREYRASFESPELEQGIYEVRVKRDNEEAINDDLYIDTIQWEDLTEIVTDSTRLHHTASLGLKIKLNDQLSSIPKVSVEVPGVFIKTFHHDGSSIQSALSVSSNPAWVAYDMLTNSRYGGGIDESRIDIHAWISWADYCEEYELEFNGIFDSDMTLWDAIQVVFRVGHAQVLNVGTKFSVSVDAPSIPTMMFNVGNIIEKSFSVSWLPISDRANEIEVTYFDENNNYLPHTIRVSDDAVPGNGDKRRAELKLYGVVKSEKAVQEAKLMLNQNRLVLQTVTFDVPTEALGCRVGDVVYVQHDAPKWLIGGRLESSSTSSSTGFELDQEVEIEDGKSYELLIHYDIALIAQDTIDAISGGKYIRLTNGLPDGNIKRAVIDGEQYSILSTYVDSVGEGIKVDKNVPGSAVGLTCELYDTDVIQSKPVTPTGMGGAGAYKVLNVDSPFTAIASKYVKYIFGESGKTKKLYRIASISNKSDFTSTISALEYYDELYDSSADSVIVNNYSSFAQSISHVSNIQYDIEGRVTGSTIQPIINLSWDKPDDDRYMGAEISYRLPNGVWTTDGYASRGQTNYEFSKAAQGQSIEFRVTARDILGSFASYQTAPSIIVAVGTVTTSIVAPTSLSARANNNTVFLSWDNPTTQDYLETEVYRGTVDNFNDPSVVKIATVSADTYSDSEFTPDTQNYYWVRAINSEGVSGELNSSNGTTLPQPLPVSGIQLTNGFLGSRAEITWNSVSDAHRYEVKVSTSSILRRTENVPVNFYSYGIEEMEVDGGINRTVDFSVSVVNVFGQKSSDQSFSATNQPPALPTALSVLPGFKAIRVEFDQPSDPDYRDTRVFIGTSTGFTPNSTTLAATSYGSPIIAEGLTENTTYYIRIQCYDTFGAGALSGEWAVTTEELSSDTLSPWATVTQADRAFIDANLEDNSIDSTKIEKLTASKIVTGTLAATEAISVEGTIESISGPYNVTMGPKNVSGNVALMSFLSGSTPVFALYENGTAEFNGKIAITNGSSGYSQLADKPSNLSDINSGEGSKLTGIESGATAGATWGSDITGQPSDDRLFNNLVDLSGWRDGATVPLSGWTLNGSSSENSLKLLNGPFGREEVVWECIDGDSSSGPEGGFHTNFTSVDTDKPYRMSIWVRREDTHDGATYFGLYTAGANILQMGGTAEGNPYFFSGQDLPELGKWYLIVGYIYPKNSTQTFSSGNFGVFDPSTGQKVISGTDFKFQSGISSIRLRAYYYYSTTIGARQYFCRPRIDVVDGSEPSISQLLYGDDPSILNNKSISVLSDGSIVGAGGGQVTIGGLGFTGDLDANNTTNTNQLVDGANLGGTAVWSGVSGSGKPADNADVTNYSDPRVNNNEATSFTIVPTSYVQANGASIEKISGGASWNGAFYTAESYSGASFVSFRVPQSNYRLMIGLNDDPSSSNSYADINFAFYIQASTSEARVNGSTVQTFGAYSAGDIFTIAYDGVNVRWYQNGAIIHTVATTSGLNLSADGCFLDVGGKVESFQFGPYTSNDWDLIGGANKPADNADVTNYDDDRVRNNKTENDVTLIPKPIGASESRNTSNLAGAICINLPQGWTNTMMKMVIDVYNYQLDRSFSLEVGGYNYTGNSTWINTFANLTGSTLADNRVRFGINPSGKCCIVIGETTSTWQYPKIRVRDFIAGYSNYGISLWDDGWLVDIITDLTGYTFSQDYSDTLIDAKAIKNQGALATANTADWSSQISGSGKPADNATVGATWGSDISGQPSDSSLLNSNQLWNQISGSGKPADNATVGATWGSNIAGQPSDSSLLNSNQLWSQISGSGKPADNADITDYDDLRISNAYAAPVALVGSSGMAIYGSKVVKTGQTSAYDESVISVKKYKNGVYASWVIPSIARVFAGLNTDPLTSDSYTSIDYSIFMSDDGSVHIYSGASNLVPNITTYQADDTFAIAYDNHSVKFFKNGSELLDLSAASGLSLAFDTSFYTPNSSLEDIQFGPITASDWGSIGNIPNRFNDNPTSGLNLTASYMGYYDGSSWQSYMDNNGNFYLNGDGSNYLSWNGTTLQIRGDIQASSVEAGVTLSAPVITGGSINGNSITGGSISATTISGGSISGGSITGTSISGGTVTGTSISGGTVTGSTIQTDANSSNDRIVIEESTNTFKSYWNSGASGGVAECLRIGSVSREGDHYAMAIGDPSAPNSSSYFGNGIYVRTYGDVGISSYAHKDATTAGTAIGLRGGAYQGLGVYGFTNGGVGVLGYAQYGLAFNSMRGRYGNFTGTVPALIPTSGFGSNSELIGRCVAITSIINETNGSYLFEVEYVDTNAQIDHLGVIAEYENLNDPSVLYSLRQFSTSVYSSYTATHRLVHVAVSGIVKAYVGTGNGAISPGIVLGSGTSSNGKLLRHNSVGQHIVGRALGSLSSGDGYIPIQLNSV